MQKLVISDIEIHITKKDIKNINLSVHPPNGEVRISAPKRMNNDTIKQFATLKLPWIQKQRGKFKDLDPIPEKEFKSGESHYFLGNRYFLNIVYIEKNPSAVQIRNNTHIDLCIKRETTKEQREKVIKEWYRRELKDRIPPLIGKWEKIMGVEVLEFGIKQMKTRWGTCNIATQRIWINLELAKKPLYCLEYIVVHEMVHLLERNHNARFKAYMDHFLPNWRNIRAELNGK